MFTFGASSTTYSLVYAVVSLYVSTVASTTPFTVTRRKPFDEPVPYTRPSRFGNGGASAVTALDTTASAEPHFESCAVAPPEILRGDQRSAGAKEKLAVERNEVLEGGSVLEGSASGGVAAHATRAAATSAARHIERVATA